jgi:DNA-binding MarR family transcriptional regulator
MNTPNDAPQPLAYEPCTCARVRRAARVVTKLYDARLAPLGIGIAQFGLLMAVRTETGATVSALAEALGADRTTVTRNLAPLSRAGHVAVAAGPDRRSRAVRLTPQGRALLRAAVPLWREAQAAVEAALGPRRTEALHRRLDEALDRLPRS